MTMRAWLLAAVSIALPIAAVAAPDAGTRVSFPSLDGAGRAPVVLTGIWFAAPAPHSPAATLSAPAAAVVLLHGCGGVFDRRGAMYRRFVDYARLLNGIGVHALVVDSLTPRACVTRASAQVPRRASVILSDSCRGMEDREPATFVGPVARPGEAGCLEQLREAQGRVLV